MKKFLSLIIVCLFMSFNISATGTNDDKFKLKKTEYPKVASDYKYEQNNNSNYNNNSSNYNNNSSNSNNNYNNSSKKSYLEPTEFPKTYSSSPVCEYCKGSKCKYCDYTGYNTNKIK